MSDGNVGYRPKAVIPADCYFGALSSTAEGDPVRSRTYASEIHQGNASVRNNAFHSTYLADRVGRAAITPTGEFEAGSFASITLTYTAGYFGIDDTGSLKIVQRFASDAGRPQFNDPKGWNYVTAEASNGAVLELRYEQKGNIRPWDRTLLIRVQAAVQRPEGMELRHRRSLERRGA